MIYSLRMTEIIESETFQRWRRSLNRDAALRINARLGRVALGNFGDAKPVRDGLSEFRIDYGPGY